MSISYQFLNILQPPKEKNPQKAVFQEKIGGHDFPPPPYRIFLTLHQIGLKHGCLQPFLMLQYPLVMLGIPVLAHARANPSFSLVKVYKIQTFNWSDVIMSQESFRLIVMSILNLSMVLANFNILKIAQLLNSETYFSLLICLHLNIKLLIYYLFINFDYDPTYANESKRANYGKYCLKIDKKYNSIMIYKE